MWTFFFFLINIGTVCRPARSICDAAEECDGESVECPPDTFANNTTPCDDRNECTVGDHCDGTANRCVAGEYKCDCNRAQDPMAACDDKKACTVDSCGADGCVNTPMDVGATCVVANAGRSCNGKAPVSIGMCNAEYDCERLPVMMTSCPVNIMIFSIVFISILHIFFFRMIVLVEERVVKGHVTVLLVGVVNRVIFQVKNRLILILFKH